MSDDLEIPIQYVNPPPGGVLMNTGTMSVDSSNQGFQLVSRHEGYEPNAQYGPILRVHPRYHTPSHDTGLLIGFPDHPCAKCNKPVPEAPICAGCGVIGHPQCLFFQRVDTYNFCGQCSMEAP